MAPSLLPSIPRRRSFSNLALTPRSVRSPRASESAKNLLEVRRPTRSPRGIEAAKSLELRRLGMGVSAAGVSERLLLRLHGVDLSGCDGLKSGVVRSGLYCTVLFGEEAAFRPGSRLRLHKVGFEVRDGRGETTFEVQPWIPGGRGAPKPDAWCCRLSLRARRKSKMFVKAFYGEATFVVPRPCASVELEGGGRVEVEVVRLASAEYQGLLELSLGNELIAAVCDVATRGDTEKLRLLLDGARELGGGVLPIEESSAAMEAAARMGSTVAARMLLNAGALVSESALRSAEANLEPQGTRALGSEGRGLSEGSSSGRPLALDLFKMLPAGGAPSWCSDPLGHDLARALQMRLPRLASWLLASSPDQLASFTAVDGLAARAAYEAQAWGVLAVLLERGDQPPADVDRLFAEALRSGEGDLAKVCLRLNSGLRGSEGLVGLGSGLQACLVNGCPEVVQDVMRTEWRRRSKEWPLNGSLGLMVHEAESLAECGVCFETLRSVGASVMRDALGNRVCSHLLCQGCASGLIAKAIQVSKVEDGGLMAPASCPFCRASFQEAKDLPNPINDPVSFFQAASDAYRDHDGVWRRVLTARGAADALVAFLPVEPERLEELLASRYWPTWCRDESMELSETEFLERMWPWVNDNMLELRVEEQRGRPPHLMGSPEAWFRHFDYDDGGLLTRLEVLRGCAKSCDLEVLGGAKGCDLDAHASSKGPACRYQGVQRLQEILEWCWDSDRWPSAVSLGDFVGPGGLAARLAVRLPLLEDPSQSVLGPGKIIAV